MKAIFSKISVLFIPLFFLISTVQAELPHDIINRHYAEHMYKKNIGNFAPPYMGAPDNQLVLLGSVSTCTNPEIHQDIDKFVFSGLTMDNRPELKDIACDLVNMLASEGDFYVFQYSGYGIGLYTDAYDGQLMGWTEIIDRVETITQGGHYVIIGHQLSASQGSTSLNFRVKTKLPTTGVYSFINPITTQLIENSVVQIMDQKRDETFGAIDPSAEHFFGLQKIIDLLGNPSQLDFNNEDNLKLFGFQKVKGVPFDGLSIKQDSIPQTISVSLFSDNDVVDLSGLFFGAERLSSYLTNDPQSFQYGSKYYFTQSDNNINFYNAIKTYFNENEEGVKVWFHFKRESDGKLYLYSYAESHLTKAQSVSILDLEFQKSHPNPLAYTYAQARPSDGSGFGDGERMVTSTESFCPNLPVGPAPPAYDCPYGFGSLTEVSGLFHAIREYEWGTTWLDGQGLYNCSEDFYPAFANPSGTLQSFFQGVGMSILDNGLQIFYFLGSMAPTSSLEKLYAYSVGNTLTQYFPEMSGTYAEYCLKSAFSGFVLNTIAIDLLVAEGVFNFVTGQSDFAAYGELIWTQLIVPLLENPSGFVLEVLNQMYGALQPFLSALGGEEGSKCTGYAVGFIIFEVIFESLTGGLGSIASGVSKSQKLLKSGKKILNQLNSKGVKGILSDFTGKTLDGIRALKCSILKNGCFVKDTPVLLAGNSNQFSLRNSTKAMAVAAAMPIVAVPIQEVQLLDYAVAHETVNSTYGLTASTDDDIYLGLMDKDPYTSDQQRKRDEYEINDTDWNEVVFEEVLGGSKAKLALHQDWINQKGYQVDRVVEINLPEQGISGSFRITSIKHIIPQKRPENEDAGDDYEYRPVTALFTHESNQVYNISFDNGERLGVTYQHPIYSVTAEGWRLAGELTIGEQVLTKAGKATVTSSAKKEGQETVYNLEVQELHNFLVGESGVVVHNGCIDLLYDLHNSLFKNADDVTHILRGNIKYGKAGGVHHKSAILEGTAKEIGDRTNGPNGLYKVKVEVKDASGNFIAKTANGGYSTFFPDDWNQIRVLDEINHAVKVSTRNNVQGNEYWGYSMDGQIKIHYYLRTDGTIISAFPKF